MLIAMISCYVTVTHGFAPGASSSSLTAKTSMPQTTATMSTFLKMVDNDKEEFMKFARQSRSAGSNDRVVELVRPLGIVLADDGQGNVYVQTVAPRGNAARTGMVRA